MQHTATLSSRIRTNPYFWYAVVCIVGLLIWCMIANIGQRNYLYETALTFVAHLVYTGSVLLGLALGIWLGMLVARRTSRAWLGWVVGIVVWAVAAVGLRDLGRELPDVGWRVKAIENYEPLE